jgi:hypothetical protein
MSTHFADLSIHFDVNSATKYIIELVPREDDSVSDFEANTGETFLDRLEALKTRLIADMYISYYADMSTVLDLDSDSEEESDDGLFVPEWTQAASSTVVAKRQNWWAESYVACTSLVETFHFRKQFSVSQPCGAGC